MFGHSKHPSDTKKVIKHQHLVFIDRDQSTVISYPDELINRYVYPSQHVLDGDIIDREEFRNGMKKWLADSDIKPADVIYVVSPSISFEKEFVPDAKGIVDFGQVTSFVDSVPFQKIVTAKLQNVKTTQVIVTNKELLNGITFSFEEAGFKNIAVFPYKSLGDAKINKTDDPIKDVVEIGKLFLALVGQKNYQSKEFGIALTSANTIQFSQASIAQAANQEVNPMVAVVIIIIFVMIGGLVMYWRYSEVAQLQKEAAARLASGRAAETATPPTTTAALEPTATIPPDDIADPTGTPSVTQVIDATIKIEILYTPETRTLAQELKTKVEALGYLVAINRITDVIDKENTIIYSTGLSQNIQARINDLMRTSGLTPNISSGTIADYSATIQLVKFIPAAPTPASTSTPTASPSATLAVTATPTP